MANSRIRRQSVGSGGSRKTYLIVGAVIVAFIAGFIALAVLDARQQSGADAPDDVKTYDVGPAGQHTDADVDYAQNPPAGGEHNPDWQNCGYYDKPVRDETAVHSQEHGAVWITYSPDLPQNQVNELRDIAKSESYVLVSPYPDLSDDTPVVASAWGKQVGLDGSDDPDLEAFIQAYQQGPQTPEPGAVCTGGTSATL
ncbi:MAG: DUF3105 domain-containing protein [Actinomycetota bacterium]|nr:DUF3105 domain-containing protein [Actinomycetota bacterium]